MMNRFFICLILVFFSLSIYAQRNEIELIKCSFENGLDWICNILNDRNAFSGNLESLSLSKEKRILNNSNVEIVVVAKNGVVSSVAITPKKKNVYNTIISQLASWSKYGNVYYMGDKKCSIIPSSKSPYFLFFKVERPNDCCSKRSKAIEIVENILKNRLTASKASELVRSASCFGFPSFAEDLCRANRDILLFAYQSRAVLILIGVFNQVYKDCCYKVWIRFDDDCLYDVVMRDIHRDYRYVEGYYEKDGIRCDFSKHRGINTLTFSIII